MLPYHGYFMEQMGGEFWDFNFETHHNDTNAEYTYEENNKIVEDVFRKYILPFLSVCNSLKDWENNKIEIERKYQEQKDIFNVIRFFSSCLNMFESDPKHGIPFLKRNNLNRKIIEDNYIFLEKLLDKSSILFKNENEDKIKRFIEKVIEKSEENIQFEN